MKAAYFAYDKNSFAALPALAKYFDHVDFYLIDQEAVPLTIDLRYVPVMVDTLMVPAEESLRTAAQQRVFRDLQKDYQAYRLQLQDGTKLSDGPNFDLENKIAYDVNSTAIIKDVVFNPKTNEVFVEKEKSGITPYHFLFVEDHQLVVENFGGFGKNIFSRPPENSHVWLTTEYTYELKKPRLKNLGLREFILIEDRLNRSVLDNWYLVRTQNQMISVQQWVPYNQFKNSDFQKFMIARIEKVLRKKWDIIQLTDFHRLYVNATPGFSTHAGRMRNSKISALVPAFNFWPKGTIEPVLRSRFDAKMKDLIKFQQAQLTAKGSP